MTIPNAGLIATQKSGPPKKPGEEAIAIAERQFADAQAAAMAIKQAAIGRAMVMPMPQHLTQIREIERTYNLSLAAAAQATGIIDAAGYLYAADHPHT